MAEFQYRGRTTRQLYRFMPTLNSQGQMVPTVVIAGVPVTFLDANGNALQRISINGEQATFCGGGARDGSVPRGVIGGGFTGPPTGPNQGPVMSPTWAPSDWETP
jgi:hypothetical protein